MEITQVLPSCLEVKYDHIKIDGTYMSTITIIKYDTNIEILKTIDTLIGEKEIEVSFHVKRENNYEILKKLTNIIAESVSEKASVSKNQIDINELEAIKTRAIELRKKIQIDNEQIYMLSTYIVLKATDINELISLQKNYINLLYAKQIIAKPNNFRQKEAYLATIPISLNDAIISKYTHNVFTEQALSKLFPFFEKDILNKNGIILGKTNNNLCSIDLFCSTNNNYNMCIFGSSGAGKSYFVKLMIIKNAYKGVRQIVVDPEGEYVGLVKKLGGYVYSIDNYNPFEINESALENNNFFDVKVDQIVEYILENNNALDRDKLKKCVMKAYNKYGITNNKESLYVKNNNTRLYLKPKYIEKFPTIKDLLNIMKQEGIQISEFNLKTSNCNCSKNESQLYCFNLKNKNIETIARELKVFLPKIYELIKSETLIYFDEIWKSIGLGKDRYVIENIYNMFKTLRKKKAGIIAISQDICDLFALDEGNFGKSILNNTNTKVLFKMEWQDIEMFERMLQGRKISGNIKLLSRGNAYVSMGNTNFNLEIKATEYEHELIEGEKYEKNINSDE